jgi:hypothetical protein
VLDALRNGMKNNEGEAVPLGRMLLKELFGSGHCTPCYGSPAIHLPLAMSYIALECIFCHPLLCMLLKLRYIKG